MPTASSKFPSSVLHHHLFVAAITLNIVVVYSSSSDLPVPHVLGGGGGGRGLTTFKEKATGTNTTFDCSPSGACVPCFYHEKKDEIYRCSETGYRIPMKCVKIRTQVDEENENKQHKGRTTLENTKDVVVNDAEDVTTSIKQRNLLEDSSSIEVGSGVYVTYRSCIPAVNQEKLSVLGFEALMLALLASSSFVIFRRKGTLFMPGAVRLPTANLRF